MANEDILACYKQAVDNAHHNLKGDDLEKCLQALKNYMVNIGHKEVLQFKLTDDL